MEKKEESKLRISEYLHSLRISNGYKTLREWCRLNDFSDVLWSHLENNLWEIVPIGKRIYTQTELDKAREEGKIEVLTEIFQTCYQEDSKTLELVEEKLSKLKNEENGKQNAR